MPDQPTPTYADLYAAIDSAATTMTLSSRHWLATADEAWLLGILVGWPGDALAAFGARYGWSADDVQRLRTMNAAVEAFLEQITADLADPIPRPPQPRYEAVFGWYLHVCEHAQAGPDAGGEPVDECDYCGLPGEWRRLYVVAEPGSDAPSGPPTATLTADPAPEVAKEAPDHSSASQARELDGRLRAALGVDADVVVSLDGLVDDLVRQRDYFRRAAGPEYTQGVYKAPEDLAQPDESGAIPTQTEPDESGAIPTQTETEWCVWYGGDDPNECAGRRVYDDQADAEEQVQWTVEGGLARRSVHYGPWTTVSAPPIDEGDDGPDSCAVCAQITTRPPVTCRRCTTARRDL